VKRYCTLFFLFFFVLFLRNTATCASADKASHPAHVNRHTSHAAHALPKTSVNPKKPAKGYTAILFRLGIEGKSIAFSDKVIENRTCLYKQFTGRTLNFTRLKYLFSFSDFLALPPEFISAFSSHAPPVLC
jgi:hypothetical protein